VSDDFLVFFNSVYSKVCRVKELPELEVLNDLE